MCYKYNIRGRLMTELEKRIKEQINYCLEYKYFRSVVWISSEDKMGKVDELPDDIMRRYFQWSKNEFQVDFVLKHSNLKVIKCNERQRGIKTTGCIIDEDISDYEKSTLIYTKLVPRIISIQNGIFESSEEIKARVHEVKIW